MSRIPWNRFAIESFVIVGSILLAFAIDAWWDSRSDRIRERALLSSIKTDMEANSLHTNRLLERGSIRDTELTNFIASSEQDLGMIRQLNGLANYTPFDSAILSGDLSLIQNSELRSKIGEWSRLSEDSAEMIPQLADLINSVRWNMGHQALEILGTPVNESVAPQILASLRTNDSFLTSLQALQRTLNVNNRKIAEISESTKELLVLIEASEL